MAYFDYGATTPVDKEILASYIKASEHFFASTASLHFLGKEANEMYLKATKDILDQFALANHNLVFTTNATEANNLAILGYLKNFKKGRIVTTKVEHASVYEVMKSCEEQFEIIYLDVDKEGLINYEELSKALNKETILVSIMWVNNVVGSIMNIQKIIEIVKKHPQIKLHVDAVQGLGKIVPNFSFNDLDMWTFSTHKLYGPKGVGGLFVNKKVGLHNILYGSKVQHGLRPGTFDLSLVIATAKAIKKFYPLTDEHYQYVKKLNNYIREGLKKNPQIIINSSENSSPYIINLSLPSFLGQTIVRHLESAQIYVSTGSACSSKEQKPERTVLAMTNDILLASSAIRISLSHLTTLQEAGHLITTLNKI